MPKIAVVTLKRLIISSSVMCFISIAARSQINNPPDTAAALTLDQCVGYALKHQPFINMAIVNVAIVKATNAINTSGWLPQVNVTGTFTHYNTLPTGFFTDSGRIVNSKTGVVNTAMIADDTNPPCFQLRTYLVHAFSSGAIHDPGSMAPDQFAQPIVFLRLSFGLGHYES